MNCVAQRVATAGAQLPLAEASNESDPSFSSVNVAQSSRDACGASPSISQVTRPSAATPPPVVAPGTAPSGMGSVTTVRGSTAVPVFRTVRQTFAGRPATARAGTAQSIAITGVLISVEAESSAVPPSAAVALAETVPRPTSAAVTSSTASRASPDLSVPTSQRTEVRPSVVFQPAGSVSVTTTRVASAGPELRTTSFTSKGPHKPAVAGAETSSFKAGAKGPRSSTKKLLQAFGVTQRCLRPFETKVKA